MMAHQSHYSNLKQQVLKEAGSFYNLQQLKDHFSTYINSRRALSKVKSLACILHLLEERDILNWRNVEILHQLADLLQKNKIGEIVQSYKKFYLDENEELCICGEQTIFQLDSSMTRQQPNHNLIQNSNHVLPDLAEAVINLSQRIGREWPYLARELRIPECHTDRIRAEYPKNFELQSRAALYLWLNREKENASVEALARALNGRHCVRFGLGSFLLEPM